MLTLVEFMHQGGREGGRGVNEAKNGNKCNESASINIKYWKYKCKECKNEYKYHSSISKQCIPHWDWQRKQSSLLICRKSLIV